MALRARDGRLIAIWVNFAVHLDTTGGNHISADYPYYLTEALQRRFGRDVVVLFNPGAMGDLNHIDVNAKGRPVKGESHPSRIGNTLAGEAIKVLARASFGPASPIGFAAETVQLPLRRVTPRDVEEAEAVIAGTDIGRADFTLGLVKAHRDRRLGKMGETPTTVMQALRIGDVGIVTMPGEAFVELGMAIRERSPLRPTFVVELANDSIGYIPTARAYEEGGYEVTSTVLAPGTGEQLLEAGLALLERLA
jgi:hypothetical protein